jgi:hypothetical protein
MVTGSISVLNSELAAVSTLLAYSLSVTAPSAPIDNPELSRPVIFEALRMDVLVGLST